MLDLAFIMYGVLLILFFWRMFTVDNANGSIRFSYMTALFVCLGAGWLSTAILFYQEASEPPDPKAPEDYRQLTSSWWMDMLLYASPIFTIVTIVSAWLHIERHLYHIYDGEAVVKHDRVINIIALPSVYAVMSLASCIPLFRLSTGRVNENDVYSPTNDIEYTHPTLLPGQNPQFLSEWRYQSCSVMASLFEAWAIYQFGSLILEQAGESITKRIEHLKIDKDSANSELRNELVDAHMGMSMLSWTGTALFVVNALFQVAVSIWVYFGLPIAEEVRISNFLGILYFIAASVALWCIYVVWMTYRRHITHMDAKNKFYMVQYMLSMNWLQREFLDLFIWINSLLPEVVQRIILYIPIIGDISIMKTGEQNMLMSALMIIQSMMLMLINSEIWHSEEPWYTEADFSKLPPATEADCSQS